jgi:membrane fusion protein (multidrug efflux system)
VRIALDPAELRQHPLRIGLSTEVRVDLVAPPEAAPAAAESGVSGTRVYELDLAQVDAEADAIIAANLHGAR